MIHRALAFPLLLCLSAPVVAQQSQQAGPAWNANRYAVGGFMYRVSSGGRVFDSIALRVARIPGTTPSLRLVSYSPGDSVNGDLDTVTFDVTTMSPIRVFHKGGAGRLISVDYDGTHATGHVHSPANGSVRDFRVDTTISAGTLDDGEVIWNIIALPLLPHASWTLPVFSWSDGSFTNVTATVAGDTTIAAPAGTYHCWKVTVTGKAGADYNVYVTVQAPVVITRFEMKSLPIAFELSRRMH